MRFLLISLTFILVSWPSIGFAPPPNWNYSFNNTKNEFEFEVEAGSEIYSLKGTLLRAATGFLGQTIDQVNVQSGDGQLAPPTSTRLFGLELPRSFTIQPPILSGVEFRPTFAVAAGGACPTTNRIFNFVVARSSTVSRNNMDSPYQPAFGRFQWDASTGTPTVVNIRSIESPSTDVIPSFAMTGNSCSNGTVTTSGNGDLGGTWRFSQDFAGFYLTNADNGFLFFPQTTIAQREQLGGTYAVMRSETTAYNAESVTYAKAVVSGDSSKFQGAGLFDPADGEAVNPADTMEIIVDIINDPFPGFFRAHMNGTNNKLICMTHFSTQAIIYCTGQSPSQASRLYTLTMLKNVTSFSQSRGFSDNVRKIKVQADKKILVGGDFLFYNGQPVNRLARLNTDGTLDSTFNPGGSGPNGAVWTIETDSSGRILVGGDFTQYNGTSAPRLIRLSPDGALDGGFPTATLAIDSTVRDIKVANENKIWVVGNFSKVGGVSRARIARLNSDGAFESTFPAGDGYATNLVTSLTVLAGGQSVIGGSFTQYAYKNAQGQATLATRNRIVKLASDGTLDSGWTGGVNGQVSSVDFSATTNRILVAGGFSTYNSTAAYRVARLTTAGALETAFAPLIQGGSIINSAVFAPDGKILIGGDFTLVNGVSVKGIARLNANGTLDTTFNVGEGLTGQTVYSIGFAGNSVVAGGNFNGINGRSANRFAILDGAGDFTSASPFGSGASSSVYAIHVRPDQKVLLAGLFASYNGSKANYVARLNPDGTYDGSFNSGTGASSNTTCVAEQSDGKMLIGGAFLTFNGANRSYVARLNADGSLDTSFTAAVSAMPNRILVQSDGKIVAVGNMAIWKMNSDGSSDPSFTGRALTGFAGQAVLAEEGKVIIGGMFTAYGGTPVVNIARINSDGSLDTSYTPAIADYITGMRMQPDGKLLVGGTFSQVNGVPRVRIARLNADGTLDTSFTPSGFDNNVNDFAVQPDGGIVVVGSFTQFLDGTPARNAARLNADGSRDSTFQQTQGAPTGAPSAVAIQNDGKILVGGNFTLFGGKPVDYIVRLLPNGSVD